MEQKPTPFRFTVECPSCGSPVVLLPKEEFSYGPDQCEVCHNSRFYHKAERTTSDRDSAIRYEVTLKVRTLKHPE